MHDLNFHFSGFALRPGVSCVTSSAALCADLLPWCSLLITCRACCEGCCINAEQIIHAIQLLVCMQDVLGQHAAGLGYSVAGLLKHPWPGACHPTCTSVILCTCNALPILCALRHVTCRMMVVVAVAMAGAGKRQLAMCCPI